MQAACTPKELKEVTGLSDVACLAAPKQLAVSAEDQAQMKAVRLKRRVHEIIKNVSSVHDALHAAGLLVGICLTATCCVCNKHLHQEVHCWIKHVHDVVLRLLNMLQLMSSLLLNCATCLQATAQPSPNAPKRLHFQLYRNPVEIVADESGHVCAVRVEETVLAPDPSGSEAVVAMGTGRFEVHEAQLVLKSIGYRSLPLEGLPFDARRGTVPHVAGRVLAAGRMARIWKVHVQSMLLMSCKHQYEPVHAC